VIGDNINQPGGKRIRADLGQESDITASLKGETIKVNLQRDSEGNTSRTILPPSKKFPPTTNQPGSVSTTGANQQNSSSTTGASQQSSAPASTASQERTLDGPAMQTLRFNRPAVSSYPHTILRTMMVGLSEPNIDLSVGL
jgi:hypothetical protein